MVTAVIFTIYFIFKNKFLFPIHHIQFKYNIIKENFITNNKFFHITSNWYRLSKEYHYEQQFTPDFITINCKTWHEYYWLIFLKWFINWSIYFESFFQK